MLGSLYPWITAHKKEHGVFLRKAWKMRTAFDAGNEFLSLETIQFLESWIADHILNTDAEFGRFLLQRV